MFEKKNIIRISLVFTGLSAVALLSVFIIPDSFLNNFVLIFSNDGIINNPDTIIKVKQFTLKLILTINILYLPVAILLIIDKNKLIDFLDSTIDKFKCYISGINLKNIKILLFVLFTIYFITISLCFIYNIDVGTNEGGQISCIKGYYEHGQFRQPYSPGGSGTLQLTYYPFLILKHLIPFSIYSGRIISLVYSILLIFAIWLITKKNYSINVFLLTAILLISNPGFLFLSSSVYGEIGATLFLLPAIYFRTKGILTTKEILLSSLFFAIAGINKFQLLPFIFIVNLLFVIFQQKYQKQNFYLLLSFVVLWFTGRYAFVFLQGGTNVSLVIKSVWSLLHASGQMGGEIGLINRLGKINSFSNLINLIIFSTVIFYYIKNFRSVSLFERTLFMFSFFISIWWIFLFTDIDFRTHIYSVIINYILFSIIAVKFLKYAYKNYTEKYAVGILILFLVLNFANATSQQIALISRKTSDECIFTLNGYKTFSRDVMKSGQKEFYKYVNKNIAINEKIFWISVKYNKYIFTEKEFIHVNPHTENPALPKNSYFLLTYIDYKSDYITDELLVYLNNNAELLFKKNYYEIYKIR